LSILALIRWAWIEKKYSRKVIKSDKNEYTNIGFFGASKEYVYQTWADELEEISEEVLIKLSEEDSYVIFLYIRSFVILISTITIHIPTILFR
jgi:hypothetical protein